MGVGEALSAAREEAGRTIEDVSRATRIRGDLLRSIEADDFSGCGGNVYARGHVRSIAQYLGLDPAEYVAEFDRTHGAPEAPGAAEIFEHEVLAMPERKGPNWTAAMATMAGVLLLIALVSLFNADPSAAPNASPVTTSSPSPTATAEPETAEPTTGPLAGHIPGNGVAMRLKVVNSRSYVTVRIDSRTVFQGLLTAGAQKDYTAKNLINVVIGNAGAVELIVNGQDLGSPGRQGEVVRLNFGPDDPANAG